MVLLETAYNICPPSDLSQKEWSLVKKSTQIQYRLTHSQDILSSLFAKEPPCPLCKLGRYKMVCEPDC